MWATIFGIIWTVIKSLFTKKDPQVTQLQKEVKEVRDEAVEMQAPTPKYDDVIRRL